MYLHSFPGFHKPLVAKPTPTHKLLWKRALLPETGRGA